MNTKWTQNSMKAHAMKHREGKLNTVQLDNNRTREMYWGQKTFEEMMNVNN